MVSKATHIHFPYTVASTYTRAAYTYVRARYFVARIAWFRARACVGKRAHAMKTRAFRVCTVKFSYFLCVFLFFGFAFLKSQCTFFTISIGLATFRPFINRGRWKLSALSERSSVKLDRFLDLGTYFWSIIYF